MLIVQSYVAFRGGKHIAMTNSYELPHSSVRLRERWGHWSAHLLIAAIGASILLGLRAGTPTTLTLLSALGLLVFVLMTWLMMRQHDRRLCESCAKAIPLNAAEQASQYRRRFATVHAGSNPRIVVPYLIILIGSNFLVTNPTGRYVWAAVQATMMYLIAAHATHRRLQPWCPWCSDGGGGDPPIAVDEPDSPRGGRQLV
jgi:hypothetical protein